MSRPNEVRAAAPVWSWREAIVTSEMPAQAKLLCLVIGLDVSELGKFSQRSRKELTAFTSLPLRTIEKYLKVAEQAGFMRLELQRNRSGHVCGTRYFPTFPRGCILKREAEEIQTARGAVRKKPDRTNRQPDRISGGQIYKNNLLQPSKERTRAPEHARACAVPVDKPARPCDASAADEAVSDPPQAGSLASRLERARQLRALARSVGSAL